MSSSGLCLPLVFTILAWGYNFVALKILYAEMSPAAAALARHTLMWLLLLVICRWWYRGRGTERSPEGGASGVFHWRIASFGILAMGIYMILFLEALHRTSAPEGAIVIATAPLFTTLFAVVARQEALSLRVLLGALVALAGVGLVVLTGVRVQSSHLAGNLLMLASAIAWALGAVLSRPLVTVRPAIVVLTDSMPAAFLVLIPYAFSDIQTTRWLDLSPLSYLAFAHFTILAGVLGFVGFFYGVQKIGAPGAMMYQYCVAPTATLCAWLFLKDRLLPAQLVGMAVVLAGVVLATAARNRLGMANKGTSPASV